jgi:hypothetical protein
VLARYTGPFLGRALRSAAHPVLGGSSATGALDLWGIDGAERWSQGGLVRGTCAPLWRAPASRDLPAL